MSCPTAADVVCSFVVPSVGVELAVNVGHVKYKQTIFVSSCRRYSRMTRVLLAYSYFNVT